MNQLKKNLLSKTNIIIAGTIALLGVGCKSQKTTAETTTIDERVEKEVAKKYGPPPVRPIQENNEPLPLKYGVPPEILREREEQQKLDSVLRHNEEQHKVVPVENATDAR